MIKGVSYLPYFLHPLIAGTIYLPLWLFEELGLSVFGQNEPSGWASPSVFGWIMLLVFWIIIWTFIVVGISKLYK